MDRKKLQTYEHLIRNLGQLYTMIRLYKFDHPIVKDKLSQLFTEVSKMISDKQSLIFSESEGIFLVNGEQIKAKDSLIERFVENFNNLQLGSLELKPGLSLKEFYIFMHLITQAKSLQGKNQIKQYLKEKDAQHIIPLFVTYKLLKENEKIVKEGEILKVDKLPSGLMERFTQDLEKGKVTDRLKKEEKAYKLLAHEPVFLSRLVYDAVKESDSIERFEKILQLIADYLIDEISSARIEKINRKILDELKCRLLSLWRQRKDRERWKEETQKIFTKMSAAMQLKGLILLYKRHKKGIEMVAGKLKNILETLPPQSLLYQKTKENLEKIGGKDWGQTLIFKFQ